MANKKISELDPVTSLQETDLVPVVTDLDTTPKSNKITWTSLKSLLAALFQTLGNKVTSFQETPDDTHYPSEKLVKDSLDAKAPTTNPTFTGTVTLPKTTKIKDTSADHTYDIAVSELTADRTVTLPLLTGNDTFMFKDFHKASASDINTGTEDNKYITPKGLTDSILRKKQTSEASSATPTPTGNYYENEYYLTALAADAEFAAPSGTLSNGNTLLIRIKDNGAARTLTWNAVYRGIGLTLPATTTISKTMYVGGIYNSADSKWDITSVIEEE